MSTWIAAVALAMLLGAACAADWRTRRIPNVLVVAGSLTGLGLQAWLPAGQGLFVPDAAGAIGATAALAALAVMGLAGLVLWRSRLFGAGDAKLLAAVAVYVGPAGVLPLLLGTLLGGGVLALLALLVRHVRARHTVPPLPMQPATRLPYALAIAAGTAGHIGWNLLRPHSPA